MSSKTCKGCRHFVKNDYIGCCTLRCDVTCDDDSACRHFAELTVFDKITTSPEMYRLLARLTELTDYSELVGIIVDAKSVLKKARGEE